MKGEKEILELARSAGIIRPRDVEKELDLPREYVLRLYRQGKLERIGRGLYTAPGALTSESLSLAEVSARVPEGVICLLSALEFHGLTTQLPHAVWIAIGRTSWKPTMDYPPLEVVRFSGDSFTHGIEEHEVDRVGVRVYSVAKTVADCFKCRNRLGLDVALEALGEAWRAKRATMDELWSAAQACRVSTVIRPYLESLT